MRTWKMLCVAALLAALPAASFLFAASTPARQARAASKTATFTNYQLGTAAVGETCPNSTTPCTNGAAEPAIRADGAGDDREWIAADGASKVCISYHDVATFNLDVNCSFDAGTTFTEMGQKAPRREPGDAWPCPLPTSRRPDRRDTYGRADGAQDLHVQTPTYA